MVAVYGDCNCKKCSKHLDDDKGLETWYRKNMIVYIENMLDAIFEAFSIKNESGEIYEND